jgi:hypothetical protein
MTLIKWAILLTFIALSVDIVFLLYLVHAYDLLNTQLLLTIDGLLKSLLSVVR